MLSRCGYSLFLLLAIQTRFSSRINFRLHSLSLALPAISRLFPSCFCAVSHCLFACFAALEVCVRRAADYIYFLLQSSFWFIAYIIIFALADARVPFRLSSAVCVRLQSRFGCCFFVPFSIHLADARIQTSADNLTENVKYILTSECTINVILICIRNDETDDWMARMEIYSILRCIFVCAIEMRCAHYAS